MMIKKSWVAGASTVLMTGGLLYACSQTTDTEETNTSSGTGGSTSTSGTAGDGGSSSSTSGEGGMTFDAGQGGSEQDACADVVVEGNPTIKPADIIFVIDNSCSMNEEINSVEQNINVNFAAIIGASQVDYRIVMVTNHGTGSYDVCIGPPLGPGNCSGAPGNVPNLFYHYDVDVQSHDSLCIIPDTFYGPNGGGEADQWGEYPNGWSTTLRTEAIKVFVEITDDGIVCNWDGNSWNDSDQIQAGQTVAVSWDQTLLGHSPAHFGTQADRNYMFYSIVGMPPKSNPLEPYTEFEPVVTGTCQGGVAPGTGYQWLSKGTHGLRFPVCSYQSYDSVFQDIAAGVIVGAQVPCEIEIPEPPPGQEYNLEKITLLWTPGGGSTQEFTKVSSLAACGTDDDKFYIEDNLIKLCPAACDKIEADMEGTLQVKIPCDAIQ